MAGYFLVPLLMVMTGCASLAQPACVKPPTIEEEKRRVIPEEEEGADPMIKYRWCKEAVR